MAAEVGLSVAAVKRRVDRLRELGVITGFTVQIDHTKLGWGIEAFTELRYAGPTPVERDHRHRRAASPRCRPSTRSRATRTRWSSSGCATSSHLQEVIDRPAARRQVTGTKTLMVLNSWAREA